MPRTKRKLPPPDTIWTIPDSLWPAVEALLADFYPAGGAPRPPARPGGGGGGGRGGVGGRGGG